MQNLVLVVHLAVFCAPQMVKSEKLQTDKPQDGAVVMDCRKVT